MTSGCATRHCSFPSKPAVCRRPPERGWRVVYLGLDAPIETVEDAVRRLEPSLVVLRAVSGERVHPSSSSCASSPSAAGSRWGGAAAQSGPLDDGAILLDGDMIAEATLVTRLVHEPSTACGPPGRAARARAE